MAQWQGDSDEGIHYMFKIVMVGDSRVGKSHLLNRFAKNEFGLFKSGCIDDAIHVIDKMLERDSDFPPDDFTGEVVFGVLGKQERQGRSFDDNEIVRLVTKLCEHGVFPDAFKLTQNDNEDVLALEEWCGVGAFACCDEIGWCSCS